MANGCNSWNVPYIQIKWFEELLSNHKNVDEISRDKDIHFRITRKDQGDTLNVLCLRQYTMGFTLVQKALSEFGQLDIIYIGGDWNGYTKEAKQFCDDNKIGLYVSGEMTGALWKNEYWDYKK